MNRFMVGDVVHLKSGGPYLTVTAVSLEGSKVMCLWQRPNGEVEKHEFLAVCLAAVE